MSRAACLLAILVLAAGSVSAEQGAKTVTAQQVLASVKAQGARDTINELFRTGSWERSVLPGIETGQRAWLEVARALSPVTDAGSSEDLGDALVEALLVAPYSVLPLLKEKWWKTDTVCTFGWDSELPGGVEPYVLRLRAVLEKAAPPRRLTEMRQECFRGIDATLKDVRENAQQDTQN